MSPSLETNIVEKFKTVTVLSFITYGNSERNYEQRPSPDQEAPSKSSSALACNQVHYTEALFP